MTTEEQIMALLERILRELEHICTGINGRQVELPLEEESR